MKRVHWWLMVAALVGTTSGFAPAAEERAPVTISADSLEVNRKTRLAIYQGNVVANDRGRGLTILADRIEFLFDERMEDIDQANATGNVRLSYGERRGVAERAEYYLREGRAVLLGHPKVWQENDVISGCRIILLFREDRSQVEGCEGERVNAVLYPKQSQDRAPGVTGR